MVIRGWRDRINRIMQNCRTLEETASLIGSSREFSTSIAGLVWIQPTAHRRNCGCFAANASSIKDKLENQTRDQVNAPCEYRLAKPSVRMYKPFVTKQHQFNIGQ